VTGGGNDPGIRARALLAAAAGVVALAAGIGIGALIWGADAPRASQAEAPQMPGVDGDATEAPSAQSTVPAGAAGNAIPSGPVETPQDAVAQFLSAEADGDLERSFTLLSAAAQELVGASTEAWVATHPDVLPPITGYEVGEASSEDGQGEVTALVEFEPNLDEITGLTPARARVTWSTVAQDGSWRVSLDGSSMEPLYPPDDTAPDAVREWAQDHQGCPTAPPDTEWTTTPLGSPTLAKSLCGASGDVEVGEATELRPVETTEFQTAFGSDVNRWARVVPVTAPVEMRAVVAPLGEEWVVVGVLPGVTG
jgi:hypothetical protein